MVQRIFRIHKLALLHKSLVVRVLGEMDRDLMNEIEYISIPPTLILLIIK